MKTEVKAKSTSRSEAEHWSSAESTRAKSGKKCPKRGKRYSRAQKDEILHYVKETSVADASSKFDVTETTIYEWQRADKRRNINANGNELLEEYEVNYYLAKNASVNGKVEALNASFQKECVRQTEFMDMTDAARSIGRWVDHYNHRRPHHGLGGLLVPADRFYGIADQSLQRIEQGLGADICDLVSTDNRGLELFRVVSYAGKPQVWLMGEKILG